jgi:hypothetical protein
MNGRWRRKRELNIVTDRLIPEELSTLIFVALLHEENKFPFGFFSFTKKCGLRFIFPCFF